jgi:hypothetical protein
MTMRPAAIDADAVRLAADRADPRRRSVGRRSREHAPRTVGSPDRAVARAHDALAALEVRAEVCDGVERDPHARFYDARRDAVEARAGWPFPSPRCYTRTMTPTIVAEGLDFPEGTGVARPPACRRHRDPRAVHLAVGQRDAQAPGGRHGRWRNGATLGADGALYVANNGGVSLGHEGQVDGAAAAQPGASSARRWTAR